MQSEHLDATWFDGELAQPQPVSLSLDGAQLHVRTTDGAKTYASARLRWPEPTQHRVRQLLLPDGSVVECQDSTRWDRWTAAHAIQAAPAARWAASAWGPWAATLLIFVFAFCTWRWVLPVAADQAALWVPASAERKLGDSFWSEIDRKWFKPSQLSKAEQQAAFKAMAPIMSLAGPEIRVSLRQGPAHMGPNAFALPGGQIVITDELVRLLSQEDGSVHPALAGVLAHEIGHVTHRHGLRGVFRTAATAAMAGLWLGDYSALLALAPTAFAQASYSREGEREADAEARRLMQAAQIDPRSMVYFFTQLSKAIKGRDTDTILLGLARHPADKERVRYFEQP